MSATAAPTTSLAKWTSERHQSSRDAVAAGGNPLTRSAAPGAISNNGEPVVITAEGKNLIASRGAGDDETLTGPVAVSLVQRTVESASTAGPSLIFDSRVTLRRFLAVVRTENRRLADATRHVSRMAVGSRLVVLPDALAAKFWAPHDRPAEIIGWLQAFRLTGLPRVDALLRLYRLASDSSGVSVQVANLLHRMATLEVAIWSTLRCNNPSANMSAFRDTQAHHEMWSAVSWADPKLRDLHLLTGEVVAVTPRRLIGGQTEAFVSIPCKLREGEAVIYDGGGNQGHVEIVKLGYDGGLTATFKTSARAANALARGKQSSTLLAHGHRILSAAHAKGTVVWVSRKPFVPSSRGPVPGESVWVHGNLGERPRRNIPLAISVNGMASAGYRTSAR